jgi:hypothetical protein
MNLWFGSRVDSIETGTSWGLAELNRLCGLLRTADLRESGRRAVSSPTRDRSQLTRVEVSAPSPRQGPGGTGSNPVLRRFGS